MLSFLRFFAFSIFITIAAIVLAGVELGIAAAITCAILITIEVAFSFDNAVINAKILNRLPRIWQQIFLTVGMLIAVGGMRFVFPIVIVMVTAGLSWGTVIDDALNHPETYAKHLEEAYPLISSFGGAFLLLLSLYFFFDHARKEVWLDRIERPLQRVGGNFWLPPVMAAIIIAVIAAFAGDIARDVLVAGLAGVVTYTVMKLAVDGLGKLTGADNPDSKHLYTGWAAFAAFMYLEVLDASFSFDGVLGAFAITDQVLLIALGLGVGAFWVRSLTIYLVRHGTLDSYRYLEHGAHYAILFLSFALLSSIFVHLPEAVTGIVGIGIIIASFISSREALKDRQRQKSVSAK
jgi:uncharacterized protein